jgi:gag-polypeptide of LTR copia-type
MVRVDVQFAQLGADNWGVWAPRVKIVLSLDGCLHCITTALSATATADEQAADVKAMGLIGSHVDDDHIEAYTAATPAKQLWDTLKDDVKKKNMARRLTLRREMNDIKKKPTETMSMYIARAKKLRDDLRSSEQQISEDEAVIYALAGLPKQYDIVVAILESTEKSLTLDDCLSKLLAVEHNDDGEPVAYFTQTTFKQSGGGSGGGGNGGNGGAPGYKAGYSPVKTCWHCGKPGHIKSYCRKWLQETEQSRQSSQTTARGVSFASAHMVSADTFTGAAVHDWLVDTGASHDLQQGPALRLPRCRFICG